MEIRDFEVFLVLAKHLNFTRAGEEVHLSQPSVSVRIRRLEEELGTKLFEQLGKRVVLTEAGRLLEPFARRTVLAAEDARQAMQDFQGLQRGCLRIGASTTPGMYLIPRVIVRFKEQYPKIEVLLSIKNTGQVEEDTAKDDFDIGFVGGHLTGDDLEVVPWVTDELVVIASPKHPLAKKSRITAKDLARQRFIFREKGSATQAVLEKTFRESGVEVEAPMELGNPEAVKQAVREGFGLAILSQFAVEDELKAKTLVRLKVRGLKFSRELKIVYRKNKHLNRATQAFMHVAQKLQG